MGFRENLKAELSYRGLLVKELAQKTGISRHTLDNYLNVRGQIPSAEAAVKIARVLGVSVEYLVTGKTEPPPTAADDELRALALAAQGLSAPARLALLDVARALKTMQERLAL